jgi:hypothetical protein
MRGSPHVGFSAFQQPCERSALGSPSKDLEDIAAIQKVQWSRLHEINIPMDR